MVSQALLVPGWGGGPASRPGPNAGPVLEALLWNLRRHGLTDILVAPGSDRALSTGPDAGARPGVTWLDGPATTGLATALQRAAGRLDETCLVVDATVLFDVNYLDLCLERERAGTLAAVGLCRPGALRSGPVMAVQAGRVVAVGEAAAPGRRLVGGGLAALSRAVLDRIAPAEATDDLAFFASLAAAGELAGRCYDGFRGDATGRGGGRDALAAWRRKPAVFFDRDGVLNVDHGFVGTPERWDWVPGAPEAVKRCNDLGYLVVVVTNQSGIGRGYFTQDAFWRLMAWANARLRDRGAHWDAVYVCPHHPTAGLGAFRRDCACRKPAPGLFDLALADWEVDLARSLVVGDSDRDLAAGAARGIAGRLFPGGNLAEFMEFLPKISL